MFAPRRILVPTDFSEHSDMALKKALDIAYQYKAKIYLLHVINDRFYDWALQCSGSSGNIIGDLEEKSMENARENLREQMDAFALAGKVEIIPEIKIGCPSQVILSEQEEKEIDLLVIASHKETGMIRRFLGNVAETVVRSATFPALVVNS